MNKISQTDFCVSKKRDAELKPLSMTTKRKPLSMTIKYQRGFTLIELLVVVLIIGILSAVAWPQYQKAVMRGRASEAVTNISALFDAAQRYYMANGAYSSELENLDISMPQSNVYRYEIQVTDSGAWRVFALGLKAGLPNFEYNLMNRTRWCYSGRDRELSDEICKSYGSFSHTVNNSNYYKIQ